jgi:hypothetical protein
MAKILKLAAVKVIETKDYDKTEYWKNLIYPQDLICLRICGLRW